MDVITPFNLTKIRFNRIGKLARIGIGLLSLGALVGTNLPVNAQSFPSCFMETEGGQIVNLSSMCGKTINQSQSNRSELRSQGTNSRINVMRSVNNFTGQYLQSGRYNSVVRLGTFTPVNSSGGLTPLLNSQIQWKQLSDVSSLRSDPFGGSLVGQLYRGEPVRVYRDTRTDNSVYVETLRGQRGWIDTWALPDASGLLP